MRENLKPDYGRWHCCLIVPENGEGRLGSSKQERGRSEFPIRTLLPDLYQEKRKKRKLVVWRPLILYWHAETDSSPVWSGKAPSRRFLGKEDIDVTVPLGVAISREIGKNSSGEAEFSAKCGDKLVILVRLPVNAVDFCYIRLQVRLKQVIGLPKPLPSYWQEDW